MEYDEQETTIVMAPRGSIQNPGRQLLGDGLH